MTELSKRGVFLDIGDGANVRHREVFRLYAVAMKHQKRKA